MSIARNILLCNVCQSLFNDPRQLRCGHSFCYQCILTHFDRISNCLVCSRCKRIHHFESFAQFDTSLIADAFLMSLVSEHRRKTTLLSTPLLAFTLEEILQRSPTPFLIAKCAECTLRKELVVCPACEKVICFECIYQHQLVVNENVQQAWAKCKETWTRLFGRSMLFDEKQIDLECQISELKSRIDQRANLLLALITQWRVIYQHKINDYSQIDCSTREEITEQYQSIERRLESFLHSNDSNTLHANELLQEIKEFKHQLQRRTKKLEDCLNHPPTYSISDVDLSVLGTLSFRPFDDSTEPIVDDETLIDTIEEHLAFDEEPSDDESTASEESSPIIVEEEKDAVPEFNGTISLVPLANVPNKKLLWSLHFKFVPQYIVLYRQSILFASDRWGFVSTWTYTNARTKPVPKKSFVLFPQFRVGTWSRVYVESFSVYKPYICVFVKGSDESLANFIAFFTHAGQLQMKVDYDHRYSLRQLICDESPKGNCIWAVDRGMHCIYKHDLPGNNKDIKSCLSAHTTATRLSNRSCDVIRMAVNQNVLALLDSRTQLVTLYDKASQKEIGTYSRASLDTGNHKLWRVEIFPDNSLLLRFDDNERSGDRSQVIHHIVVHVKKVESGGNKYEAISRIQATNVYGFAIGGESEVVVGLRKANCFEGLVACYV